MNEVKKAIVEKKGNVGSIFFTAGFPKLDDTQEILLKLQASGVDFVEVGMPYSDPMADGPTIQESSSVALDNGMNLSLLFDQLLGIKDQIHIPLVLMGYFNQVLKFGVDEFLEKAQACGVQTLILPDLPMIEYQNIYKEKFAKYGISNVFLITPQTSKERIKLIDQMSDSFIYVVASASITGTTGDPVKQQESYFQRIAKMNLKSPQVIGFGISNSEGFQRANRFLDGAIIGSAYIKSLSVDGVRGTEDFVASIMS